MSMSAAEAPGTTKARVRQQLRGLMEILAHEPEGMHYQALMKKLREVLPPTEQELTLNASGFMRYNTNAGWWSVDLVKAGWLEKRNGIWSITESGREALVQYPNSYEFGEVAAEAYRRWKEGEQEAGVFKENWEVADAILARVPKGQWVSAGDLGKVSGFAGTSVGIHIWNVQPPGWFKVLRKGGRLPAAIYNDQERLVEQRALLAEEGIPSDPRAPSDYRISLKDLEGLAAEVRGTPRAWLVRGTSVRGSSIVPDWLSGDFVSLPASQLPEIDLASGDTELEVAVESGYDGLGYSQRKAKFDEIKTFIKRVKPGHLILTTSGADVYVGEVAGAARQVESPGRRSNLRRDAHWLNPDNPLDTEGLGSRLEGRLRTQADIVDLSDIYDEVKALATGALGIDDDEDFDEDDVEALESESAEVVLSRLSASAADELLIDRRWLDEFVDLLVERRQVILYGPPGTGKTFLAQAVAEELAGPERVRLVQFHPSYSYEDFFEGYRPAGTAEGGVSLQLVPGPFRKIVDLARANPSEPYFLIVDEINRANLAKVFGELYFLLEYRDRSIDLLYSSGDSGSAFSLPANVYIIGTMNTADRSIALVDAAMRRRFAFLSLHPEDERLDLVLRSWLVDRGMPEDRVDLMVELNRRIADKDFKIGPSYLMSADAGDDVGLDRIWRTSILPLLEEYHVGDGIDVKAKYGLSALRRALATQRAATEELDAELVEDASAIEVTE